MPIAERYRPTVPVQVFTLPYDLQTAQDVTPSATRGTSGPLIVVRQRLEQGLPIPDGFDPEETATQ
jgi:hypothetical protein